MRGDFHIHTIYSDGALSVKGIVKRAQDEELDIIAITDHDFVGGAIEASEMDLPNLRILIGLELSTYYKGESVHILGYFPNAESTAKIQELLEEQRKNRVIRAGKIKELLYKHYGIKLDLTELLKRSTITRGSICQELIKQDCGYTREEIFRHILGDGCPAYVPSSKVETLDGIKAIKESGGVPVLAHPVLLKKVKVEEIIALGVEGLEAIYPRNKKSDEKRLKKIARKNNLLITAGSDFHDYYDGSHGNIGDIFLDEENIKALLNKVFGDNNECS